MAKEVTNRFVAVAQPETFDIDPGDEKKAPSIFGKLLVVDGPDAGRQLPWRGSLAELKPGSKMAAQEITFKQLRSMGWQDNDIVKLTGLGSTKVEVTETMDEYNGKVRPQYSVWDFRGERATLRDEDKKDFAKRFKALAAAAPVVVVSATNAAPEVLPEPKSAANGAAEASEYAPPAGSAM